MNKELLIKTGEAAFGINWQTDLAKRLNVSARSVRYWVSGEREIPKIANELVSVLEKRKREINEVIKDLTALNLNKFSGCYTFGDVEFYKDKSMAMSEALRKFRPSIYQDKVVIPYFCMLEVVGSNVDGERVSVCLYAVKFMEKQNDKEFNHESFSAPCRWVEYEFDPSQAGTISYEKL